MKLKTNNYKKINFLLKNNVKTIIVSKIYLFKLLFIIIIIMIIGIFIFIKNYSGKKFKKINENYLQLDKYETNIFDNIKEKLISNKCSIMWKNQKEFINGAVRKFRPKKILEVGVARGGASAIILNAIQDINNSHLYSIDISVSKNIGECVINLFPEFKVKWTLLKGNIVSYFIEKIGKDIDMVLLDTSHFEPGEILDYLLVLPFLKEEAIVILHDIANQINFAGIEGTRHEWAPYIIFNLIRGKKFYPSGDNVLLQDIGVIILEKNQNKYIYDYFRALGGQWELFPEEKHINLMRKFIKKYYDEICLSIFEDAIKFNRDFVKNNRIIGYYQSKAWNIKYRFQIP